MLSQIQVLSIISLYKNGNSVKQINILTGYSTYIIRQVLIDNNIPRRDVGYGRRKVKHFNDTFFDKIDIEAKAYFLGLLFADGSISEKRNSILLELSESDKDIIYTFSKLIFNTEKVYYIDNTKYNYRCKNASNSYKIEINSAHMKKALIALGCIPHKSLILEFPSCVPNELIHHFIRGYFDGDGSISSTLNRGNKGTKDYMFTITTTQNMCENIQNVFITNMNIQSNILSANVNKNNSSTKTLHCGGNRKILKIMNWLYKDATYFLQRKYDKYLQLKKQCEEIDNRKAL